MISSLRKEQFLTATIINHDGLEHLGDTSGGGYRAMNGARAEPDVCGHLYRSPPPAPCKSFSSRRAGAPRGILGKVGVIESFMFGRLTGLSGGDITGVTWVEPKGEPPGRTDTSGPCFKRRTSSSANSVSYYLGRRVERPVPLVIVSLVSMKCWLFAWKARKMTSLLRVGPL